MNFFKKIFSKKDKKEEQQPQPKKRSNLDTTKPNKIAEEVTRSGEKRNPVWIEQMSAPDRIRANEKFEIVANGHLSDLAWELAETTTTIQGKEIIVTVIGKRKIGIMAGQALKEYQTSVKVEGLPKGTYVVKPAKGNAKELIIKVE